MSMVLRNLRKKKTFSFNNEKVTPKDREFYSIMKDFQSDSNNYFKVLEDRFISSGKPQNMPVELQREPSKHENGQNRKTNEENTEIPVEKKKEKKEKKKKHHKKHKRQNESRSRSRSKEKEISKEEKIAKLREERLKREQNEKKKIVELMNKFE